MAKLTLSVDPKVVSRAKRIAQTRKTSLSRLVESYLRGLAVVSATEGKTPIVDSLEGCLKEAEIGHYKRHLREKYR